LDWNTLVAEFRALGGAADNVVLEHGPRGRGLFAIDPATPVRLYVPPNLLVRCADTEIRNGHLVVKTSSSLGKRERAWFDRYQENFSWGAGVFQELWQMQRAWNQLPPNAREALLSMWPVNEEDLAEPSEELCRKRYIITRMIKYHGDPVLMPILELVNHGGNAARYDRTSGVVVEGMFPGEVLARYGDDDCWGTAVKYGFCEARNYAYAIQGAFRFEDHLISISRAPNQSERYSGFLLPIVQVEDHTINYSFLALGNMKAPHAPRSVFVHVTKNTPIRRPDTLFDIIQHRNQHLMLKFLRGSEGAATPLVAVLRSAAYQQLETLSHHWGTELLAAGLPNTEQEAKAPDGPA
jgi:hypothetical protein